MEGRRKRRHNDSVYSGKINNSAGEFGENEEKIRKMEDEHKQRPDLPKDDPNVPLIRPIVEEKENKCLDLAFAMDCTSSMTSYIQSAKDNIRKIVEEIVASEKSDVRLALIEYRDHPPQDRTFITRAHDFTFSPKKMRGWLTDCRALGGGDFPEAVADALNDVLKLTWREDSVKICVLISDAPPHGVNSSGDNFPEGCPDGLDPLEIVHRMAQNGITLYSVGCEPSISPYKELFMGLAFITGGQYVPLTAAKLLTDVIIGGAQEEISLEAIMAEVDKEVQEEMTFGRAIDSSSFAAKVHTKLQSKGVSTKQLLRNNEELETADKVPVAKKISTMDNLKDVRKFFKPRHQAGSFFSFGSKTLSGGSSGLFGGGGGGAFGFGGAAGASGSSATFGGAADSYSSVSSNISFQQTSRLVMKSIARNQAQLKKE